MSNDFDPDQSDEFLTWRIQINTQKKISIFLGRQRQSIRLINFTHEIMEFSCCELANREFRECESDGEKN